MTGTVWFHRNVGTNEKPVFAAGNLVTTGNTGRGITLFDRAIPQVVDWNADGKHDLVVAGFDQLIVFTNVGAAKGVPRLDDGRLVTFGGEPHFNYERKWWSPWRDKEGFAS